MSTVKEVRQQLRGVEGHVAVAIWCREDVIGKAKEMGFTITDEAADEILDDIERHHDCELGITWLTLECCIEDYAKEHGIPQTKVEDDD